MKSSTAADDCKPLQIGFDALAGRSRHVPALVGTQRELLALPKPGDGHSLEQFECEGAGREHGFHLLRGVIDAAKKHGGRHATSLEIVAALALRA